MASIPGILGYVQPGAFSRLTFTYAGSGNPGGVRSVAIIGLGQHEEYLVTNAAGDGTDGLSVTTTATNNYNYASVGVGISAPDGMHFNTEYYPIVKNQFKLYKNGSELIRSKDTVVTDDTPVFLPGTDYAVDFATGAILLAPAYTITNTGGTDGYFEHVTVPANVPSETWTIAAIDQPASRATVFSVVGSKSGQVYGYETFQEQRNSIYANGLSLDNGGIYYYNGYGQRKSPPLSSFLRSDPVAYDSQGYLVLDSRPGASITHAVGTTTATLTDSAMTNFNDAGVIVGHYVEFVSPGDANSGSLYKITDVTTQVLTLEVPTTFSTGTYTSSAYVVVSSDEVGKNFYNRSPLVYGANKVDSSKKTFYVRIFDSNATNLSTVGSEEVYMSPGEALYECSDDYHFDEVTGKWTGTWYRGVDNTGLTTNEVDSGGLGRQAAVGIYTSDGKDSGLSINFAPSSGISDFDSLTAYYDVQYNDISTAASDMATWTATGSEIVPTAGSVLSSISVTSGVATATSSVAHGLTTGKRVVISGTTSFDGTYTITDVPTATTFTFDHADAPTETSSGMYFSDAETVNREFTISPSGGWSTYEGYIRGTLVVKVDGTRVSATEIPYGEFVGRSFRLAESADDGATITATFTVGDYNVARLTGFRKGDMWQIVADGKYDNGLISFSLVSGETPFNIGDTLSIEVKSGALEPNDNLVAAYIPTTSVNDPEEFFDPASLYKKHGYPSKDNTLALGAQLAFLNNARSVIAVQAKPTKALISKDIMLASKDSGDFIGNGGLYYTAHTHGSQSFNVSPEDEYGYAKSHELMHARDYDNAMTTLHRHDSTNYLNPSVNSTVYRLTMVGNPHDDVINFFYTTPGSPARQVFLNRVPRSFATDSIVSIPCTKNFGYSCNTSGRTIPSPLHNSGVTTTNSVNNPFFLDSRDAHYLWIYADDTTWWDGIPSDSNSHEYDPSTDSGSYGTFNPYVASSDTEATPVFAYPDDVRNQFSNDGVFPTPDTTRYDGYDTGIAFPCGALFRMRSGLDVNVDLGASTDTTTYDEIDSRPIDNYLNPELAFHQTCTDSYDSVVGKFLKTAYNGGNNDPNNITLEDAMLYMRTQRDDMSYMIWSDNTVILSDKAGLKEGEGIALHFVDEDDAEFVDADWSESAKALESTSAYWIVPLPDAHFSMVQQTFKTHVETMSATANRRERQLLTGAFYNVNSDGTELALKPVNLYDGSAHPVAIEDIGVLEGIQGDSVADKSSGLTEDIANYGIPDNFGNSYRVVYFYPDKIVVSINGINTAVPGTYLAAAAGGYLSGQQYIAEPLTWKNLAGFTITRDRTVITSNPTIANYLGAAGITVVQGNAAGGKVLHCKTTTSSGDAFEEEPTSINIADLTSLELRNGLQARFTGKPQNADLPHQMLASTKNICQSFLHRKLLNNFDNIQVAQNTTEPRQYDVKVEILPVLSTLWISINVQVGI